MASTSPPILPISNNTTTAAAATSSSSPPATSADSQLPLATPAFRAFLNNITESVRHGLSQRRPWSELLDRTAFSKPESFSDAALRLRKNYSYFRVNYLAVVASILAFSLLSHPLSLILLLALLSSWLFLYLFRPSDRPLLLFGRTFSDRETLGILILSSILLLFLTSVGSVLISALMLGVAIVCAHASFRVPEDLFLDEQEPSATTGFLSFLGGSATNAAAAAAAAAAVRV